MKTSNDGGYDTHEVGLDRESMYQKNLEDLRQWARDLEEENGSAAGLLAWAAFEIASRREQVLEYARAWTDGFTPSSIKERVARELEKKTKTPIILVRVGDTVLMGEIPVRIIVAEIIYETAQDRFSMWYDSGKPNYENHMDVVEKAKTITGERRFSCVWKTDDMSIWRAREVDLPEPEPDRRE